MARDKIPVTASDVLLHTKTTDRVERISLPFTRYGNIMHAPNVVTEKIEVEGAPFHLLKTGEISMTKEEIIALCGNIV